VADNRPQEAVGLLYVQQVIRVAWLSGWQSIAPENDDAIDGIVFFRRKGRDTGQVLYVQVKAGPSYFREWKSLPDVVGVQLGEKYIEAHRPRWQALPGPVIVVYVLPRAKGAPQAWWADLRSDATYSPTNRQVLLLKRSSTFGPHSKGHLRRLTRPTTLDLPTIVAQRRDVNLSPLGKAFKSAARATYLDWSRLPVRDRTHPVLGPVEISRVGWRHITRADRRPERIVHSLHLLGIARRMIAAGGSPVPLGRTKSRTRSSGSHDIIDYLALRANVVFPHRGPGVAQMVLRRKRSFDNNGSVVQRLWFYSIYEIGRSTPGWT
jgi:hypothetical protein